jgi:hypothetical protein
MGRRGEKRLGYAYQKPPLSEHVSSAPQFGHLRWQVCMLTIAKPQRGHCTLFWIELSGDWPSISICISDDRILFLGAGRFNYELKRE